MKTKNKILLFEDDLVLGSTISAILTMSDFEVKWLKDGSEAIKYLNSNTCDLILSDLMMPTINGEELMLLIRKDSRHNAIPFIIITANLDETRKLKVLENGVNDYVTKPFNAKELIFKVKNLLEFKKTIIKKLEPDPFSKVTIQLSQKDIIISLNEILTKNLKSQISAVQLSKMLFISKSTLDKRIRRRSNKNITQYMREFKLEYAIKLIDLGERSIHFLISETGFNSSSYFTTSFKAYTGMTPRDYIKFVNTRE